MDPLLEALSLHISPAGLQWTSKGNGWMLDLLGGIAGGEVEWVVVSLAVAPGYLTWWD